jgi:ribonuclease D
MSSTDTAPDATWVDQRDTLVDWLNAVPDGAILGLDTEFMRRNTFYPQLALLQFGYADRYALVDPLAFDIGDSLQPALADRPMTTVMHSASEDLEALAPLLANGPRTLFDTQIAAAFVGMGLGISYRALVAELVGDELDKGETRSDWLQRPLTDSQRLYATLDVVHLRPVHDILSERLIQRDRMAWFVEDCERLKQRASHRDGDAQPQRAFKGSTDWSPERQALLRRVLRWREVTARTLDRPRPWMLEDAQAASLVYEIPRTPEELDGRTRGQRALRSAQRLELFDLLQRPVTAEETEATAPIPGHPFGEAKKALGEMKPVVDQLALDMDLPPGLLCPRRAMEEYVVTHQWPESLSGWREGVLHDRLANLLP